MKKKIISSNKWILQKWKMIKCKGKMVSTGRKGYSTIQSNSFELILIALPNDWNTSQDFVESAKVKIFIGHDLTLHCPKVLCYHTCKTLDCRRTKCKQHWTTKNDRDNKLSDKLYKVIRTIINVSNFTTCVGNISTRTEFVIPHCKSVILLLSYLANSVMWCLQNLGNEILSW